MHACKVIMTLVYREGNWEEHLSGWLVYMAASAVPDYILVSHGRPSPCRLSLNRGLCKTTRLLAGCVHIIVKGVHEGITHLIPSSPKLQGQPLL